MKPKYTPAAIDFEADLKECLTVLERGGLVLYPTDTIWGIGCDATNAAAVERVYRLKGRADGKALIVLLGNADNLDHYVVDVPEMAPELLAVAVKPLTIIYEGAFNVAPNLLGDNDSLGVRIPHEAFCQQLCARFGKPIVSTSANLSGHPAPGGLCGEISARRQAAGTTLQRDSFGYRRYFQDYPIKRHDKRTSTTSKICSWRLRDF